MEECITNVSIEYAFIAGLFYLRTDAIDAEYNNA